MRLMMEEIERASNELQDTSLVLSPHPSNESGLERGTNRQSAGVRLRRLPLNQCR
jgi:hypothetical protein